MKIFIVGTVLLLIFCVFCGIAGAAEDASTHHSKVSFQSWVSEVTRDNWPENIQDKEILDYSDITVCSEGCDYTSIQAAINGSSDGDRILVSEGVYPESLVVNKSLDIRGIGGTVIVGAPDQEVAIMTTSDIVLLRNLSLVPASKVQSGFVET